MFLSRLPLSLASLGFSAGVAATGLASPLAEAPVCTTKTERSAEQLVERAGPRWQLGSEVVILRAGDAVCIVGRSLSGHLVELEVVESADSAASAVLLELSYEEGVTVLRVTNGRPERLDIFVSVPFGDDARLFQCSVRVESGAEKTVVWAGEVPDVRLRVFELGPEPPSADPGSDAGEAHLSSESIADRLNASLTVGLTQFISVADPMAFNGLLHDRGYSNLPSVFPQVGATVMASADRLRIVGEIGFSDADYTRAADSQTFGASLGQFTFALGWDVLRFDNTSVFPLIGYGGRGIYLGIDQSDPWDFAGQIETDPDADTLRQINGGVLAGIGFSTLFPITVRDPTEFSFGISLGGWLGYFQQVDGGDWYPAVENAEPLTGGPRVDLSGPTATITLGVTWSDIGRKEKR